MNTSKIHRIKVLALLGLPLLALAMAVMVFAWGSGTQSAEAANGTGGMKLSVKAGETDCPVGKDPTHVCVGQGLPFTLSVETDGIPAAGYLLIQTFVDYGPDLVYKKAAACADEVTWPDAGAVCLTAQTGPGLVNHSVTSLPPLPPPSTYEGNLVDLSFNCSTDASVTDVQLLPKNDPVAGADGAIYTEAPNKQVIPTVTGVTINCVPPPTATPTATPPPIPKMSKSPAISNHWLVAQSTTKIPPSDCLAGTATTLSEALSQSIVSPDPKDPSAFQQLAAFEFEVHYDNKKVCVDLTAGAEFQTTSSVCLVEDDAPDSKPQLEGVARIGCYTVGKSPGDHAAVDDTVALATIDVYPQPEIYSQAKPNQDNGVVVQINNVNCDLGDEQGHAIPIFSCDDADITFRYLEGDVSPDCVIDVDDAQAIAFRWGVEKGSLIYKDFMNLEPSGPQSDNDIDINDLQFVFGRFGSVCSDSGLEVDGTHPAQVPVNPKATP